MKIILVLVLSLNILYSKNIEKKFDLYTFKADFVQKIFKDDKEIAYKGKLLAKKPNFLLWSYTYPVSKKIYIVQNEVVIDEPELEQAIVTRTEAQMDFFAILEKAIKLDDETYQTTIEHIDYTIKFDKNLLSSIIYEDAFANLVEINFTHQQTDIKIPTEKFIFVSPPDYDMIYK
jgi:outer membrane lipoprotein carrier protein